MYCLGLDLDCIPMTSELFLYLYPLVHFNPLEVKPARPRARDFPPLIGTLEPPVGMRRRLYHGVGRSILCPRYRRGTSTNIPSIDL